MESPCRESGAPAHGAGAKDRDDRLRRPRRLDRRWASGSIPRRCAISTPGTSPPCAEPLERHGGTVEKYIGDAVMAVLGMPVLHEDDALRAVRAAVEMRDAMAELNRELEHDLGVGLELRIGINTGEVDRDRRCDRSRVRLRRRREHRGPPPVRGAAGRHRHRAADAPAGRGRGLACARMGRSSVKGKRRPPSRVAGRAARRHGRAGSRAAPPSRSSAARAELDGSRPGFAARSSETGACS